jgi:hypothetical protein
MATSSRTDRSAQTHKNILTKSSDATRAHTSALDRADSLRVVSLKAEGHACKDCTNRQKVGLGFLRCSIKHKLVSYHNICHLWKPET